MSEIKEAVAEIRKVVTKGKEEMAQEMNDAVSQVKKQLQEQETKHETVVKGLNEELAKKGTTIEEIQGEIKELKAKEGRLKQIEEKKMNLKESIASIVLTNKDAFANFETTGQFNPIKFKAPANISSSNLSGDNYISYLDWRPGMEPQGQFHFRDMPGMRVIQSETDFVQFPRANTPIGEGSFARVTEGATKPQIDRDYTMISLTLTPMAGYAIVSRQSLRNIVFLQNWLPQSMTEQLMDAEDSDFANKLVAAATGSSTTSGITATPERLIYFIKNLVAGKYRPNAIAADPAVWAALLVYRPGTDNGYGMPSVITVGPDGTVRILGIPIYPVNWLTGNRVVVGDWTKAAIIQSEGLVMRQTDSHASTFITNEVTFLLERTENLAIFRPDAFITTTLS